MNDCDYPAIYRAANSASTEAQIRYLRFVKIHSLLLIAAAGLGVYGIEERNAAIAAAVVIIGAIFSSVLMMLRRDQDTWYRARAVAESVKTSTWRFMMRADPYFDAISIEEAKSRFRNRIRSILNEHKDLLHHFAGNVWETDQITKEMCRIRLLNWDERAVYYRDKRIDEQRGWYARKSSYNRRCGRFWFSVLLGVQGLAVVCVILRVGYPSWGYWPAEVFVVASGATMTWIQVKKFRELAAAYTLTVHEVGVVKGELESVDSEKEFANFVGDSENAFSREHTQWLARKDVY